MYIDRIVFPVLTLGYGQRVGIWTLGCPRKCHKCSNPELQDINTEKDISIQDILSMILPYKDGIDGITITGGDPFFQKGELSELVVRLKNEVTEDILVYTGYTLEDLENMKDFYVENILSTISVLIDGPYIDSLNDNRGIRGSSNQEIYILNEKYKNLYEEAWTCDRKVQNLFYGNSSMYIGIPLKDYRADFNNKLAIRGVSVEEVEVS